MLGRLGFFSFFVEEGDLDFAIFSDEEFGVWLNLGEDAPPIWSCFLGCTVVAVLMSFVVMALMIRMFFSMVMIFMVVLFGSKEGS